MHDAGPCGAADRRPRAAPAEECMDHGPGVVPRRRVDDHPRGLVDDGHVFVLIDDDKRDLLRPWLRRVRLRYLEIDDVSHSHAVRRVGGMAVQQGEVTLDQPRRRRTAQLGSVLGKESIEPWRRAGSDQLVGLRIR